MNAKIEQYNTYCEQLHEALYSSDEIRWIQKPFKSCISIDNISSYISNRMCQEENYRMVVVTPDFKSVAGKIESTIPSSIMLTEFGDYFMLSLNTNNAVFCHTSINPINFNDAQNCDEILVLGVQSVFDTDTDEYRQWKKPTVLSQHLEDLIIDPTKIDGTRNNVNLASARLLYDKLISVRTKTGRIFIEVESGIE